MLRLGIIGCGNILKHHVHAIQGCSIPVTVTALVDINKERAKQAAGELDFHPTPKVFGCVSEALQWGGFEATDLLIPHDLHQTIAIQCLQAGKHVLLEKPLAHSPDSCEQLLEAAEEITKEKGTVFMVAENAQYWPEVVCAQQLVADGKIGDLFYAKAHYWESLKINSFAGDREDYPAEHNWRYDVEKVGGGVLVDGSSHWLRPLRMWFGEVDEVVGVTGHDAIKSMMGESMANALLRFKNGKYAEFEALVTEAAVDTRPFFRLFGQKLSLTNMVTHMHMGEITIHGNFSGGMTLYNDEHPMGLDIGNLGGFLASYKPEIEDFVKAVVTGSSPKASAKYALGELKIAWAVYRSLQSKKWEKV